jgi:hypothetical protein
MITYIKFELNEFITPGQSVETNHATVVVCCDISSKLTKELDLVYDKDFWFEEAYYAQNGKRILKFAFKNDHTAFIS